MIKFVVLTILSLFIIHCQGSVKDEIVQKLRKACMAETGIDLDTILKQRDSPELKCYDKCILVNARLLNPDTGKFDMKPFIDSFPAEVTESWVKIFTDCKVTDFTSSDYCEEAFKYQMDCFSKQPGFYVV
ncbi:unnamed protein product [Brassicogethes aeneus]|uniref:Uncharacterized protein n=1 Tax=Brassicogethes aeneus TaxID=1431903 RepID=A0A9P0FGK4_BRAAE|nr:unnamed protein product [Brassicogethes aeneus]